MIRAVEQLQDIDLDQKTVNFILDLICDKCGLSDFKESEEKIKKYDEFLRDSRYEIIKIEEEEERKYKERTKQLITKFSKYQV